MHGEHTLILGERFLLEHKAVLDYGQQTCTLQKHGKQVVLQTRAQPMDYKRKCNIVLNATQFIKAARKARQVYLMLINKVEGDTAKVAHDDTPKWLADLMHE